MDIDALKRRISLALVETGKKPSRAALDGGLHKDAIRNILRGKSRRPTLHTIEGVARGLGRSVEWLRGETTDGFANDSMTVSRYSSGINLKETPHPEHEAKPMGDEWLKLVDETEEMPAEAIKRIRRYASRLRAALGEAPAPKNNQDPQRRRRT